MDDLDLIEDFVVESLESLQEVDGWLGAFRSAPDNPEPIHAAFRALHSIKGCAACLGLEAFKNFAHSLENTLAEIRDGKGGLSEPLQQALLAGCDCLDGMLNRALAGEVPRQVGPGEQEVLARITAATQAHARGPTSEQTLLDELQQIACELARVSAGRAARLSARVQQIVEQLHAADQQTAAAQSSAPPQALDHQARASQPDAAPKQQAETATEDEPSAPTDSPARRSGGSPVGVASPAAEPRTRFVRIREDRLEEFVERASSVFISGELLHELQGRMAETGQLGNLVEEMRELNRDLSTQTMAVQQSVMALRRVPAAAMLRRFAPMARTLAAQLGKQLNVHLSGEETEVDKLLAEDLEAPLTHLVRNVVDHAIETPEQRRAQEKSPAGNLWLEVAQSRNHLNVTVRDDGRGIDPEKIRNKAVEKGLRSRKEVNSLSDQQAIQLIFCPGFSTVEKVSDVSGRGVGMDVVRSVVEKHRGRIQVDSHPGRGTTFRLEIPIRNAVLFTDGLLVHEAGQRLILPLQNVRGIFHLRADQLHRVQGQTVARLRGQCYAVARLAELLGRPCPPEDPNGVMPAALVADKGRCLCLRFEKLLDNRHVVAKQLDGLLSHSRKISGVAQLGGGRLGLVLNVSELIHAAGRCGRGVSAGHRRVDLRPGTGAGKNCSSRSRLPTA